MTTQTKLQAFHNDPVVKQKYINRIRQHREAEHLVKGVGWESNGIIRGCAIGCLLESYEHSRFPIELGLPEWLAHMVDQIFEGLDHDNAMALPGRLLEAIPVGMTNSQLEWVKHSLSMRRLTRLAEAQQKVIGDKWGIVAAIRQCIDALEAMRDEDPSAECKRSAARSAAAEAAAWSAARWAAEAEAWTAARSAAWSAEAAVSEARSAARSAAWSAAWSARSARSAEALSAEAAARSVAKAAVAASRSTEVVAWKAAWQHEAYDLIELIAEGSKKGKEPDHDK